MPRCPVAVSLFPGNNRSIAVGQQDFEVDLATAQPQWSVLVATPGFFTVFVSVRSLLPCTARCRVPMQQWVGLRVHPDATRVRGQHAFDQLSRIINIEKRQSRKLRVGVGEQVFVDVSVPNDVSGNLEDLSVEIESTSFRQFRHTADSTVAEHRYSDGDVFCCCHGR